jgi:hypothetical protein
MFLEVNENGTEWVQGKEMAQTMYAHINKSINNKKIKKKPS